MSRKLLVYYVCTILFLLANLAFGRRGGSGGGTEGPDYSKCNLRMDYWYRYSNGTSHPSQLVATAQLRGQKLPNKIGAGIYGWIKFEQQRHRGPARITGQAFGFLPGQTMGLYILENGRFACNGKAGKHYNPTGGPHGNAKDCMRHVGDLEAVPAAFDGKIEFTQFDPRVQLQGPSSVIGRSVALLALPYDTEFENGTRSACGVIAYKRGSLFDQTLLVGEERAEDQAVPEFVWYSSVLMALLSLYVCLSEALNKRSNTQKIKNKNVAYFHYRRVTRIRQRRYYSFTNF